MDLDDRWFLGGMAVDVYHELAREENNLLTFSAASPWLAQRRHVVDWMIEKGASIGLTSRKPYQLCSSTVHLAVLLFDSYLDRHPVKREAIFLAAAAALVLAAKVEEQFSHIPRYSSFIALCMTTSYRPEVRDFAVIEREMLQMCGWRLMLPTAPLFAPYYLTVALLDEESDCQTPDSVQASPQPSIPADPSSLLSMFSPGGSLNPITLDGPPCDTPGPVVFDSAALKVPLVRTLVKQRLEEKTNYLLQLSLKDVHLRYHKPSVVAASCVALSREQLSLVPWTTALASVTGLSRRCLAPCIQLLRILAAQDSTSVPLDAYPSPSCSPRLSPEPNVMSLLPTGQALLVNRQPYLDPSSYIAVPVLPWHNARYVIKQNSRGEPLVLMMEEQSRLTPVTTRLKRHAVSSNTRSATGVKRSRVAAARAIAE